MNFYQILGLCLGVVTLVVATKFTDCGSKGAKIHSAVVAPCKDEPCVIELGEPYSLKVSFTATENTTRVIGINYFKILGKTLAFPSEQLCHVIGCPTVAGKQQSIVAWIRFKPVYPEADAELTWLSIDDMGKPFFCLTMPFKLKDMEHSLKLKSNGSLADFDTQTSKFNPVQIQSISDDSLNVY